MTHDFVESITVEPELVHLGESVTIRLTSQMEYVPLTLEVTARYLEQEFTVGDGVRVTWDESGPVKRGQAVFTPNEPGNHMVRFGELHRAFGVADDTSNLCTITLPYASDRYDRGNQLDFYHPDLHTRHIPVDYAIHITDHTSLDADWDVHKTLRGFHVLYGDGIIPSIDTSGGEMLSATGDGDSSTLSAEEADSIVQTLRESWDTLGYGTLTVIDMETPFPGLIDVISGYGVYGISGIEPHLSSDSMMLREQCTAFRSGAGKAIGFHGSFVHPVKNPNALNPTADRQGTQERIDSLLERDETGVGLMPVILNGDAFEEVEVNRGMIAYLIEKPRTTDLIFCRKQAIVSYALRHYQGA